MSGRVNHDLGQEIQEQRISFRKDLHKQKYTLFHYLFLTLGNL